MQYKDKILLLILLVMLVFKVHSQTNTLSSVASIKNTDVTGLADEAFRLVNPVFATTTREKTTEEVPIQKVQESSTNTRIKVDEQLNKLADRIIECESGGKNVEIVDSNGEMSRGIAQFQDKTWEWMSSEAHIYGSSTDPIKARAVLVWALQNGYGPHWTCYNMIINKS